MRRIVLRMACIGALLVAGSGAALAGPHHGGHGNQGNYGNHGNHGHHGHHYSNYGNYSNYNSSWGYRPYTAGYRYGAQYMAPYPAYPVAPYAVAPYGCGYGQQYGFGYSSPGFSLWLGR